MSDAYAHKRGPTCHRLNSLQLREYDYDAHGRPASGTGSVSYDDQDPVPDTHGRPDPGTGSVPGDDDDDDNDADPCRSGTITEENRLTLMLLV